MTPTRDWQQLFEAAMSEKDETKYVQLAEHAKNAIHSRIQELLNGKPKLSDSEHVVLRDALNTLTELPDFWHSAKMRKPGSNAANPPKKATG
jgi:predicted component of type VI protein secretion system